MKASFISAAAIAVLVIMTGVLLYQNIQLNNRISYLESPAYHQFILEMYQPTPTPPLPVDETTRWQAYRDELITFLYPPTWHAGQRETYGLLSKVEFSTRLGGKPLSINYYQNTNQGRPYRTIDEALNNLFPQAAIVSREYGGIRTNYIPNQEDVGHILPSEDFFIFSADKQTIVQLKYLPDYGPEDNPGEIFSRLLSSLTVVAAPYPTSSSASCVIQGCHGYDVTCGPADTARACTMEFRLEDTCRQYVRCEQRNSTCTKITDPKFSTCVACVKQCSQKQTTDSFECVEKCVN